MKAIRHLRSGDRTPLINLSKSTKGYVSQATNYQQSHIEYISGLEKGSVSLTLICHSYIEIEIDDNVEYLGNKYYVKALSTKVEEHFGKFRTDFNDFPSETIIALLEIKG